MTPPTTCLERFAHTGDGEAFRELVHEYQGMVYSTCLQVLERSSPEVDNAVQDTFLKLARSVRTIHGNVGAWLHACARTTALDRRKARRIRRHYEHQAATAPEPSDEQPGDDVERDEQVRIVRECLEELPERDREVVSAYYFDGLTQRDIADRLGVSQVAVQKRLAGALETLRGRCLRRGVAVASLLLLLKPEGGAGEVPATLAAKLEAMDGAAQWSAARARDALLKGALAVGIGALVVLAVFLAPSMSSPAPQARSAAPPAIAALTTQAPVPLSAPPAVAAPKPYPLSPTLTDVSAWTLDDVTAKADKADVNGKEVPVLRLATHLPILIGAATIAVPELPATFAIDYDYRVVAELCPFTSIVGEPALTGIAGKAASPFRPISNADEPCFTQVPAWRHYHVVFRHQSDGSLRDERAIDDQVLESGTVTKAPVLLPRIHLRVIDGEMLIANLKVTEVVER